MRIVIKKCHICNNFFKGYPSRKQFTCSLKCRSRRWKMLEMFSLKNNSNWKGGKTKYSDGYIVIKDPLHPFSDKNGYVREHRLIVEKSLNRFLDPQEVIHHINGKRDDNRLENL